MSTTETFELPFGVERDDVLHTTVIMRRVRNEDLIAANNDRRVQELKRQGHKISATTMQYAEMKGTFGVVLASQELKGDVDPVALHTMEGIMAELYAPLLTQIILRIGDIDVIDKGIINKMTPADMMACTQWYQWMNTPPKKRGPNPDEQEELVKEESEEKPTEDPSSDVPS